MRNLEIIIMALRHFAQWRLENIVHVTIKMMPNVHVRKKNLSKHYVLIHLAQTTYTPTSLHWCHPSNSST